MEKEVVKAPVYRRQPLYGIIGWIIEWIGMAAIYTICKAIGWDWFKTTSVVLFACFACFWWGSMQNWPFHKLKQPLQGICAVVVCFVIGVFQWYYMEWAGYNPYDYAFPVILNTFFLFLVTNFLFENIHMKNVKNPIQGFLNATLWYFGAYLMINLPEFFLIEMPPFAIPAWWFPVAQWYFLCMATWPTRGMRQPSKGVYDMLMLVVGVFIMSVALMACGVPYGSLAYIAWIAVWSATGVPLFVFLENYPWRRLKQPAMGIVGLIVFSIVGAIEMLGFYYLDWNWGEVVAFAFSGVCWEFMMAYQFGYGFPSCLKYLTGGIKE